MRTIVRIVVRIAGVVVLLAIGFAVGFPLGREAGFMTGSEWAIIQASIVAREAGKSMPVTLEDGQLHVVVKQPEDLYVRARQRAAIGEPETRVVVVDGRLRGEEKKIGN